ncbi:GTP cyclohydrolase II [Malassezia psittaci]|uniref:GTP cyclohydrolase II n=1 Tax=Malassezia psittaci TaxID=1821823 RepID=A0AAF0F4Q5_9BASI|nr:GTP cyclohydrolase II [Malassezia psittaci]
MGSKPFINEHKMKASADSSQPLQVRCHGRTRVPTPHGELFLHLYRNNHDEKEHLALVIDPAQNQPSIQKKQQEGSLGLPRHIRSRTLDAIWHPDESSTERLIRGAYVGRLSPECQTSSEPSAANNANADHDQDMYANPLVRIHSECYTGETIGSKRCDCGEQLEEALSVISSSVTKSSDGRAVPPRGVVVYMRQEGRGIGLLDKLFAYNLQDMGHDTVTANVMLGHLPDARKYDISSAILKDLGINACRLLTNNPEKMEALAKEGIHVSERVPVVPGVWKQFGKKGKHFQDTCANSTMAVDSVSSPSAAQSLEDSDWDEEIEQPDSLTSGIGHSSDLERYLRTKVEKMGHMLVIPDTSDSVHSI